MFYSLAKHAEAYRREAFQCGNCSRNFDAKVITWVDVTKTPEAKQALLKWEFNSIQCSRCGCRHFSGTPFFYEDFEEGLLVAVFPGIPAKRGKVEKTIRAKYGYYPVIEFFYDMTQIWVLVYFLEYYKINKHPRVVTRIGQGEERLRKILRFLKEDALMIDIREKLTETILGYAANDELEDILGRAVCKLEEMLLWPLNAQCMCGADLSKEFMCCGKQINIRAHDHLLSRHYVIYCPVCKGALSEASCEKCGRVYTWKLGTVDSYRQDESSTALKTSHGERKS